MIRHFQYKKICLGRDYLQNHYTESFSLTKVAEYSCMSQYHFSRVFTKVTEDFNISEICEKVGYLSIGSFSTLFNEKVGMSPTQYRSKLRSLANDPHSFPMQSIPLCFAQNLFGFNCKQIKNEDSNI